MWTPDPSIIITAEQKEAQARANSIPDSVSARQFKLQLLIGGLLDEVEAWVAAQDKTIQIAYEYSSTFVRGEPMMQQGFVDLGFTSEQIDEFFLAASKL